MIPIRIWTHAVASARLMFLRPLWAALVVITLALGIGATTATFMVANAVLWKPLPFRAPQELAFIFTTNERRDIAGASAPYDDIADWRAGADAFAEVAPYQYSEFTLGVGDDAVRTVGVRTDRRLFALLGVAPLYGRALVDQDQERSAARVAIISHPFWLQQFGGRPNAIGEPLDIEGERHDVVGVMPAGFHFPHRDISQPPALYLPLGRPDPRMARQGRVYTVMARLAPGRTLGEAETQLRSVARELEVQHPRTHSGWSVRTAAALDEIGRGSRSTLILLLGAVATIMCLAWGNTSMLLLARGIGRLPEFDLRMALGASQRHVIAELMTETAILGGLSGIGGVVIAAWSMLAWRGRLAERLPRMSELELDWRVAAFGVAITVTSVAVCALAPAFLASTRQTSRGLRSGGEAPRIRHWHRVFIIGEVALATLLSIAAATLVMRLIELQGTPIGVVADRVLSFDMHLPAATYRDPARVESTHAAALEALAAAPGVAAVGGINILPPSALNLSFTFALDGDGGTEPDLDARRTNFRVATPAYFGAVGIPILQGRMFDRQDRRNGLPVAIVNQRFVQRYFGTTNPLGRNVTLNYGMSAPVQRTIVGVVGDVRQAGPATPANPEVYIPYAQEPFRWMSVVMKTNGDPLAMAHTATRIVHSIDPAIAVDKMEPLAEKAEAVMSLTALRTTLVTAFAALALVLAMSGVFGMTAFMTARRVPDLAVRMALGASRPAIARLMIWEYSRLAALGAALGLVGMIGAARLSETILALPLDPGALLMVLVAGGAIIAAVAATCYSTYTAVTVDPSIALKV